jgi:small-conductance mechanosensitive channel
MNGNGNITGILTNLSEINLVQVAAIVIGAWLLVMISQRFLTGLSDAFSGRTRHQILAAVPVVRLLVLIAAILLVLPRLVEPTVENLVALLGAVALALGFAFKDYVSSLIAGIVTLYEMPYRLGDWIEVDGAYGEVTSIGMRAAELVTLDDTVVIVPHLKLWDRLIHNANDGTTRLLTVTEFYLHPQHDAAQVQRVLHRVALTSPFLDVSQPIAIVVQERPWGTQYRLKAYPIDPRQQIPFKTDLTTRAKAALADIGVAFATLPAVPDTAGLAS